MKKLDDIKPGDIVTFVHRFNFEDLEADRDMLISKGERALVLEIGPEYTLIDNLYWNHNDRAEPSRDMKVLYHERICVLDFGAVDYAMFLGISW